MPPALDNYPEQGAPNKLLDLLLIKLFVQTYQFQMNINVGVNMVIP